MSLADLSALIHTCKKIELDGSSAGAVTDVSLRTTGEVKMYKAGYPRRAVAPVVTSTGLQVGFTCDEFRGPAGALLSEIVTSLSTGVVPTREVALMLYRPLGGGFSVTLADVAIAQSFSLSVAESGFSSLAFNGDLLVPSGQEITNLINVATIAAPATPNIAPTLLSGNNLAIGLNSSSGARVSEAVKSASIEVSTEYYRVETGYPKKLLGLVPLEHTVSISIECEDILSSAVVKELSSTTASFSLSVALLDGGQMVFTLPGAVLKQDTEIALSKSNLGRQSLTFEGTGETLLTLSIS